MSRPLGSRHPGLRSLSVAVAGLFAGHVLVYRLIAPNALQRTVLLAGTGHSYLPLALALGVALAMVAGIVVFARGLRRGAADDAERRPGVLWAVALPAAAQALAFLGLETLERALAGAPLGSLLGPLLPVGVALQIVVGALGGLILVGLDRAGERVGRAVAASGPRVPRHPSFLPLPGAARQNPLTWPRGAFTIRGPPPAA